MDHLQRNAQRLPEPTYQFVKLIRQPSAVRSVTPSFIADQISGIDQIGGQEVFPQHLQVDPSEGTNQQLFLQGNTLQRP